MQAPAFHPDETKRLGTLDELHVLYTPSEERFDRITRLACSYFDMQIALVSLVAESCQWFKSAQGITAAETSRDISFCGHAILQEDALIVENATEDERFFDNPLVTGEPFIRFYAGQPIVIEGQKIGTLCVIDSKPHTFNLNQIDALKTFGAMVENELKLRALNKSNQDLKNELACAKRDAMLDPLTKTWNRRAMDDLLAREFRRASFSHSNITLMMIDVDHFKTINDTHGHLLGDIALQEAAQRIRMALRPSDLIIRYGGDEFLIFLNHCDAETAKQIASRIHTNMAVKGSGDFSRLPSLSVSIGMKCIHIGKENPDIKNLIQEADSALYASRANRNHSNLHNL